MTDPMEKAAGQIQITIDGPAASGKSTVARRVAERLGGCYVNTGDMYRAVTWLAQQRGLDIEGDPASVVRMLPDIDVSYRLDAGGVPLLYANGTPVPQAAIRAPGVASQVSYTARIPEVRQWLVARQRAAAALGLIVMEGRDIGTVVFPAAAHKFFLSASPEVRARRRLAQAGETADGATVESVAADIARRDLIDSTRAVAPLRPAPDAIPIDSSALSIDAVVETLVAHVLGKNGKTATQP